MSFENIMNGKRKTFEWEEGEEAKKQKSQKPKADKKAQLSRLTRVNEQVKQQLLLNLNSKMDKSNVQKEWSCQTIE